MRARLMAYILGKSFLRRAGAQPWSATAEHKAWLTRMSKMAKRANNCLHATYPNTQSGRDPMRYCPTFANYTPNPEIRVR